MKHYIYKLLLFFLMFFIIDKGFILIRNYSTKFDYDRRIEMVLEGNINKDLIIMGSSRGETNLDVQIIHDSLYINAYNLSIGGSTPEFQEFLLDLLIKYNRKPKLIIKLIDDDFELMYEDINGNGKGFRVDRLYPLMKYKEVRDELVKRGDKNSILSKLFILHQLNRTNFDFRNEGRIDTLYGALPRVAKNSEFRWNYSEDSFSYDKSKEQKTEISHFISFQEKCALNNIRLIYATAPAYKKPNVEWIKRMKELTDSTTIFYIHDINDKRFEKKAYFGDNSHLNKKGAEVYTNNIIGFIKNDKQLMFALSN